MAQGPEKIEDTEPFTTRPRILLADGQADMRQYLTRLLSEHYEIDVAADAATALTLARQRPPDLIVANVMMRTFADFDLLRECRREDWGKVPIILYANSRDEASFGNVTEGGSNDVLIMPFSERQLVALIRAHTRAAQLRYESMRSLRLSEDQFRTLKTMLTPTVWVAGPRGEIRGELAWWWEKLTGQTPEQYAGFGWLDVVHPDDKDRVVEIWRVAIKNKTTCQTEFRVRRRNGSYGYVRSQGAPVRDGADNVRGWIGTLLDIDDQKQAEEKLRRSEERHRTFVNMTTLAVWTAAPNRDVMTDLSAWTELTGQTPDEYRGFGWLEALHPDDKQRMLEDWQHALRDGTTLDAEYRVRRRDGTYAYVRDQGIPLRNSDGSVREWIGTVMDIDARKCAEDALRASEEELRANFELAGIGQVETDPKTGRYVRVNSKFCEMVGYSADELLTMTYLDITHPEDRAAAMVVLLGLLRGIADKFITENRYVRKDGSILWGLVTTTLVHDAHRRPLRTITMIGDVTERKQSEALALCQKRTLEMVAQGAPLSEVFDFVILDVEKQATIELRASIQILDEEGKQFRICAAPSLPESYRQAVTHNRADFQDGPKSLAAFLKEPVIVPDLSSAQEWTDIAAILTPYDVRSVWSAPIISSDQKSRGTFCFYSSRPRTPGAAEQRMIENITQTIALAIERKEIEAERESLLLRERAAREQAEEANRLKDEFLAVVSHELRAPLNAINGWSHLLLKGGMDREAQVRALQSIQRQVRSQSQLVDDLLDVARIASGKLRLELSDVDPSKVINAALDVVRQAAQAKRIDLIAKLDPERTTVSADSERLQQVVWNLLSNAIKFTPRGGSVEIQLRHTDSGVEIVVADTGHGISQDFLPFVFDRFRQADVSSSRTHGGLGLGLAIVRQLIELHGGTVSAASDGKGKGATFTVRLPLRAVRMSRLKVEDRKQEPEAAQDINTDDLETLKDLRVLVVEDSSEDREVLAAELTQQGATVSASASAAEALTELDRFRPDVLLADIGMPGEDGYYLIRKIRACSRDHGGLTPAIALTAYSGESNRKRALEAGYQKHMSKPADPNELARAIARLARGPLPTSKR